MKRSAMKNLSHGASFHPKDKIAPSKRGTERLNLAKKKPPEGADNRGSASHQCRL